MPRIALSRSFSLFALLLLLCTLTVQRPLRSADAPAARLVIQSAVYGDLGGGKTVDVLQKIAGLVKNDSLWVRVSSSTFGDPAPNAPKKLRVGYTVEGIYHSKTIDEGEPLDISTRLIIRKAVYGSLPKGPTADVTEDVAAMVEKNSLSVKASNAQFGDPAQGLVKKLRVEYTFDGKEGSKTVNENATLTITNRGE